MRRGPSVCVAASRCGGLSAASSASSFAWGESAEITGKRVYRGPETGHSFVTLLVALAREADLGMRDHLLYELARDLSSSLELDVVLRKVMDRPLPLMRGVRGFIVLVDPATGLLSVQMSNGEADPEKTRQFLGSRTGNQDAGVTGQAAAPDERG